MLLQQSKLCVHRPESVQFLEKTQFELDTLEV